MTRRFARKGDGTLPGSDVASGLRSTGLLRASSESPRRLNPQHSRRLGHPPCQWDGLPFTGLGKETCCSGACDDGAGAAAEISPDASPGSSAPFCLRPCRPKGAGGWCGKWRRPAMCWLRAGERSGGIALILRWRPPAYDHPRRLSRCVLGQPGEPAAELNRSRRLAGLVEGGQDRGDVGFINCEHTWSMSAVRPAEQAGSGGVRIWTGRRRQRARAWRLSAQMERRQFFGLRPCGGASRQLVAGPMAWIA